ncbi:MAG: hypothetical protein F6K58_12795 [Symploca sp. SIO2E9]|nr:hypothetical protein [Symploca sp. SIO2E9]
MNQFFSLHPIPHTLHPASASNLPYLKVAGTYQGNYLALGTQGADKFSRILDANHLPSEQQLHKSVTPPTLPLWRSILNQTIILLRQLD